MLAESIYAYSDSVFFDFQDVTFLTDNAANSNTVFNTSGDLFGNGKLWINELQLMLSLINFWVTKDSGLIGDSKIIYIVRVGFE